MKRALAFVFFVLVAVPANAQSLADRAAKIFADGRLSKSVLAIQKENTPANGAIAVQRVSNVFATYDKKGLSKGLVGTPRYFVSTDGKSGKFHCYVSSKHLKTEDVVKFFDWLTQVAGQGRRPTRTGPAKWDDGDTSRFIEGKRAEFSSGRNTLILELIFFYSDKGPVGALTVTIK